MVGSGDEVSSTTEQRASVFIWLPSVAARTIIFVAGPFCCCDRRRWCYGVVLSRQNCVTGWAEVHHCIVISACVGRLAGSVGRPRWSGEQAQHSTGLYSVRWFCGSRAYRSHYYIFRRFKYYCRVVVVRPVARESPSFAVLWPAPGHRSDWVLDHVQERKTHDVRVGHYTEQGGAPLGQR